VGFGTPVALLIGIVLILVAVGLFFLDKFKPGYKRESDTVYAILFLAVGIMSLVNWNQNFLESFQLLILAGMLITLILESIRRRTPNNAAPNYQGGMPGNQPPQNFRPEPAGRPYREPKPSDRNSKYDNYDYQEPVYRSEIQAEFDDGPVAMEQRSNQRQIRGSRETRDNRRANRDYPEPDNARDSRDNYFDDYSDSPQDSRESRRSSRRDRGGDDYEQTETNRRSTKRRGPSLETDEPSYGTGNYSDSGYGDRGGYSDVSPESQDRLNPDESPELLGKGHRKSRAGSASVSSPVNNDQAVSNGAPRRRPKPKLNLDEDDAPIGGGDYVDYQPLDKPLKRSEGSANTSTSGTPGKPDVSSGFVGGPEESGSADEPIRSRRRHRSETLGGSGLGSLGDPLDLGSPDDEF
jgi:hypothetical protein